LSPGERASGTHWLRGLEGLKATLEDEVKWTFLTLPGHLTFEVNKYIGGTCSITENQEVHNYYAGWDLVKGSCVLWGLG
jgi:hypothetical protein